MGQVPHHLQWLRPLPRFGLALWRTSFMNIQRGVCCGLLILSISLIWDASQKPHTTINYRVARDHTQVNEPGKRQPGDHLKTGCHIWLSYEVIYLCPISCLCLARCSEDEPEERCDPNPCDHATCVSHPDAQCAPNMCGQCSPEFFDDQGNRVYCSGTLQTLFCFPNPCVSMLGNYLVTIIEPILCLTMTCPAL